MEEVEGIMKKQARSMVKAATMTVLTVVDQIESSWSM